MSQQTPDKSLTFRVFRQVVPLMAVLLALTVLLGIAPASMAQQQPGQQTRALSISRVEPRRIAQGVTAEISIYGTDFTADSLVRLRGIGLQQTTFLNSQALMAQVPGSVPAGTYTVEVFDPTTGNAIWDRQLEVIAPPPTNPPPQPTSEPPAPIIPTDMPPMPSLPTPMPGQPNLTARNYTIFPDMIKPGDAFALTFEVVNLGNRTAQSIVITLEAGGKFLPGSGQASATVPNLAPGQVFLVALNAIAASDTPGGPNALNIKFTYTDFENTAYTGSTALTVNVEAVTTAPQLTLSGAVPQGPVRPGQTVLIDLTISNTGTQRANQVLLRIGGESALLLPGPSGDSFSLGDIEPGASRVYTAEMTVSSAAKAGPQAQAFTLSYQLNGETKDVTGSFTLDVARAEVRQPLLVLESYMLSAEHLAPGDRFTLSLVVKNVGRAAADSLLVTFGTVSGSGEPGSGSGGSTTTTPSQTFAPLGTGGTRFIGVLDADGGTVALEQEFIVDGAAKSGVYSLPITLSYLDSDGEAASTSLNASVIVVVPPQLRIDDLFPVPESVNAGDEISVGLNIVNIGRSAVQLREATVSTDNGFVGEPVSTFLGALEPAAEIPVNATVFPESEGTATVTVTLNYIDELNRPRSIERVYTVEVFPIPEMPTDEFEPPIDITPEPEVPVEEDTDLLGRLLLGLLGLGSGK